MSEQTTLTPEVKQEVTNSTETEQTQEKTFTQTQLNAIINERLKKYADYNELSEYKKTHEEAALSEVEKLNNRIKQLETFEADNKSMSVTLENMLNKQIETIPEERRKLIPDNFSINQKLEYITNNSEFLFDKKIDIRTPDNKHGIADQSNPNLIYGKYTSVEDFAAKDKQGFLKAIQGKDYYNELKRVGLLVD